MSEQQQQHLASRDRPRLLERTSMYRGPPSVFFRQLLKTLEISSREEKRKEEGDKGPGLAVRVHAKMAATHANEGTGAAVGPENESQI